MTSIPFVKMHGLGNDFILVERKALPPEPQYAALAQAICHRNFGIGGDGLIIIDEEVSLQGADIRWRIFNSDGSEPQMCGNGIRCFAKYVVDKGILKQKKLTVETLAGLIVPELNDDESITVDMGTPILHPSSIPLNTTQEIFINEPIDVMGEIFHITAVSMGNPHVIIFHNDHQLINILKYGPAIEIHPLFPEKTNVEFVKVLNKNHVMVDVWERGCGITLACGTGACATVVAASLNNLTDRHANVTLPGGDLIINWDSKTDKVFMTGPATYVFEGVYTGFSFL